FTSVRTLTIHADIRNGNSQAQFLECCSRFRIYIIYVTVFDLCTNSSTHPDLLIVSPPPMAMKMRINYFFSYYHLEHDASNQPQLPPIANPAGLWLHFGDYDMTNEDKAIMAQRVVNRYHHQFCSTSAQGPISRHWRKFS